MLSILPIWHAYERILFYLGLYVGATIVYSKPIPSIFLRHIEEFSPTIIPGVPRLFEAIYDEVWKQIQKKNFFLRHTIKFFYEGANFYFDLLNFRENKTFVAYKIPVFFKLFLDIFVSLGVFLTWPLQALGHLLFFRKIAKKFGRNLHFLVSGGAHLPLAVDKFYRNIRIHMVEGYGMTEMGPLITLRGFPNDKIGSVGPILDGIEYYLKDIHGEKNFHKGEFFVKSPHMMVEYYKNPEATKEIIMSDGYLKTGDIVEIDVDGAVRIIGRTKNVIVLANGENIEAEPYEESLQESSYISFSLLVGHDQKFLGVLIVPNFEALEEYAKNHKIPWKERKELLKHPHIQSFYRSIVKEKINLKKEFERYRIANFYLLPREFSLHKELTSIKKVKRLYVETLYAKEIESLFH